MTALPAAALHANAQFRIHQTSGSSTCCDYWFVDDIHRNPARVKLDQSDAGSQGGSTQPLAEDTYAPLHLQADIPAGSFLNWSVLNTAGEVVPGMHGSNDSTFLSTCSITPSWTSSECIWSSRQRERHA